MRKKGLTFCLMVMMVFAFSATGVFGGESLKSVKDLSADYNNAIENSFIYAKQGNSQIFNTAYLESGVVGSTFGDWTAFGVGRYGYQDNNAAYLTALEKYVTDTYAASGTLHRAKATEWQRIALAVLALGGDPTNFGTYHGKAINLVADGVYDPLVGTPWKQGMMGGIFGLLVLDAKDYKVPSNAPYDREDFIEYLLNSEIKGGGFSLDGKTPDADVTGMVLQALAPYEKTNSEVKAAIDRGLTWLSMAQNANGGYATFDAENSESCVQVLCALCALGIDAEKDSRFVKNGNSLLDTITTYYNAKDGGFIHSNVSDPQNPSAVAGESNVMATDQVRYGLIAYARLQKGQTSLYDFTDSTITKPVIAIETMTDVTLNDWFYSDAAYVLAKGIMKGTDSTTFSGYSHMTRGQFVTVLGRYGGIADSSKAAPTTTKFGDVDSTQYYAAHIAWAAEKGIVNGVSATAFAPDAKITREQMAKMMCIFADTMGISLADGSKEAAFADDSGISSWAKGYVYKMKASNIINGVGGNRFAPQDNATRGAAGKMIHFLLER